MRIRNDKIFEMNDYAMLIYEAIVIKMEANSEEGKEYKEIVLKNIKGVRYVKIPENPSGKAGKDEVIRMIVVGHKVS